jgi:TatD DNase family protein
VSFVDTHAHLGDPQFDADRDAVLARAEMAGVTRLVEIADSPDEWDRAVRLARARPASSRCALGLHPYYADRYDGAFPARLRAALDAAPEAVAIGEIGLDYAKAQVPRDAQLRAFRALLAAAREWDYPVVIHCRDAYADLVPLLRELFPALGADGPVTYKKNDALREAFRRAGPGVAVLETDCPYLPPQSARGKRNEPAAIPEIAAKLAEVWGVPLAEAAAATTRNAADLYRWP